MDNKKYFLSQMIDMHGVYETNSLCDNEIGNNADYISKYYDTMTSVEIDKCVLKCLTEKEKKRILLRHELKYLNRIPIEMTRDEFKKNALKIFLRYQSKAGGFCFDDQTWICRECTTDKYVIKDNTIVFENTINTDKLQWIKTYLSDLSNVLNLLASNVNVTTHFISSKRDRMTWVLLKCKFTNT